MSNHFSLPAPVKSFFENFKEDPPLIKVGVVFGMLIAAAMVAYCVYVAVTDPAAFIKATTPI